MIWCALATSFEGISAILLNNPQLLNICDFINSNCAVLPNILFNESSESYGYRRMSKELNERKIHLNHKTVLILMNKLGL